MAGRAVPLVCVGDVVAVRSHVLVILELRLIGASAVACAAGVVRCVVD